MLNNIKKNLKVLTVLLFILLLIILLPFLIEIIGADAYIIFINTFFKDIKFKEGLSIYIDFTLLLFTIVSVYVNLKVLNFYLKSHDEILKQNEKIQEKNEKMNRENNNPLVTLKLINQEGMLYLKLKNSGNSPAYDIKIKFFKEIVYDKSDYITLNKLPIFNNLSILDKEEEIKIFFNSAHEFYINEKNQNLETDITITYYNKPFHKRDSKEDGKKEYNSILSFKELNGILYIHDYTLKDISQTLEKLGDSLMLNIIEDSHTNNLLKEISKNIEKLDLKNNSVRRRKK